MTRESAKPVIPRPIRREPQAFSRCCGNGKRETSMTLSRKRTAGTTVLASDAVSRRARSVNGASIQVDRAEIARPIRGQRNLAARVRRRDCLAVPEVVHRVYSVYEEHARLRGLISGAQNLVP